MSLSDTVGREYGWMLSQAMRLCRNAMDAEDLAMDAVLKILGSSDRYDSRKPFRPWASVIILNTYKTRFRHEGLVTFTDMDDTCPVRSCSDASARVGMSEVISAIRKCRRRSMTVDCVLMYAGGFTYDEIAEFYSIPPGTVRSRINYARKMIREELDIQYVK